MANVGGGSNNIIDGRLTIDGVRKIIRRRAREADIEGKISGHSLHVGSVVSLVQAGTSVVEAASCGRMEVASDAGVLRKHRVGKGRRCCTVQIWKMTASKLQLHKGVI